MKKIILHGEDKIKTTNQTTNSHGRTIGDSKIILLNKEDDLERTVVLIYYDVNHDDEQNQQNSEAQKEPTL